MKTITTASRLREKLSSIFHTEHNVSETNHGGDRFVIDFNFKFHSNIATSLLCSSTDSQSAVHTDSQSAIPTSLSPNTIPILMSYFKSLSPSTITMLMSHSDAQFSYNFHWEAFSLTLIGTLLFT